MTFGFTGFGSKPVSCKHETDLGRCTFQTFEIVVQIGDARWFLLKMTIWVNFGGPYIDRKMLIYFIAIWNILQTFRYLMTIWYILSGFGIMYQENSGNPGSNSKARSRNFGGFCRYATSHSLHTQKAGEPGLPDGIFSNQKSKFGYIWESVLQ
jgi:hypothetical protein